MTAVKGKQTEKKTETANTVSAEELAKLIAMFQSLTPEMQKCVNLFVNCVLLAKNI